MREITKKTLKKIKQGYHDDLMEAIEFLIDTYDEDKYDAGYRSCLEDLSVRSYRLAEHIVGLWNNNDLIIPDNLAKAIENYYTEALKQE